MRLSICTDALWRIPEPDNEHGDVVGGVIAVGVFKQLLRCLPRIRNGADELNGALVVDDVPQLYRR